MLRKLLDNYGIKHPDINVYHLEKRIIISEILKIQSFKSMIQN